MDFDDMENPFIRKRSREESDEEDEGDYTPETPETPCPAYVTPPSVPSLPLTIFETTEVPEQQPDPFAYPSPTERRHLLREDEEETTTSGDTSSTSPGGSSSTTEDSDLAAAITMPGIEKVAWVKAAELSWRWTPTGTENPLRPRNSQRSRHRYLETSRRNGPGLGHEGDLDPRGSPWIGILPNGRWIMGPPE